MSPSSHKKLSVWLPLLFSLVLIVGMYIGFRLNETLGRKRPLMTIIERNDRLEEIIELISSRYVDSVSSDLLYQDAIEGILVHLDPHTNYIPAIELSAINEDLEGEFKGIGVEFYILKDTVHVVSVINGGPSDHAGIRAGDRLVKVDDSLVAGIGITNEQIIKRLRGIESTAVKLNILRPSTGKLLDFNVKRGIIPLYSIDVNYMLDSVTGYIKINRFSATTYGEFVNAMDTLKKQGMSQLILDLRQNPGGYLDAATNIVDEFIAGNHLIVYTQGRTTPKKEYKAGKPGRLENGKLVVLVDEGSASASEVIAGSIQDWDRGLIIGRKTFGKGLVQEQYELTDGSALRLTTARYYTPTGRSIQRPYNEGREAYNKEYENIFTNQENKKDTLVLDSVKYYTNIYKRTVYGNGGIIPDVIVPSEAGKYSEGLWQVVSELSSFVYDSYSNYSSSFSKYPDINSFNAQFYINDTMLNDFRNYVYKTYPSQTKIVWNNSYDVHFLRNRIKALFARMKFNNEGFYKVANTNDEVIIKAWEIINSKNYSSIIEG